MARAMADGGHSAELWLRAQAPLRGVFRRLAQAGATEARFAVAAFAGTKGLWIDQLRSCGTGPRSYYTSASMVVPDGFPRNTESTATGISEQALTPCS